MATDVSQPPEPPIGILDAPFDSALSQRYLVYALSTITARSLPDVRDGLKPGSYTHPTLPTILLVHLTTYCGSLTKQNRNKSNN